MLTHANAQPSFVHYQRAADGAEYRAHTIQMVTIEDEQIAVLPAFVRSVALFSKFGLPLTLD